MVTDGGNFLQMMQYGHRGLIKTTNMMTTTVATSYDNQAAHDGGVSPAATATQTADTSEAIATSTLREPSQSPPPPPPPSIPPGDAIEGDATVSGNQTPCIEQQLQPQEENSSQFLDCEGGQLFFGDETSTKDGDGHQSVHAAGVGQNGSDPHHATNSAMDVIQPDPGFGHTETAFANGVGAARERRRRRSLSLNDGNDAGQSHELNNHLLPSQDGSVNKCHVIVPGDIEDDKWPLDLDDEIYVGVEQLRLADRPGGSGSIFDECCSSPMHSGPSSPVLVFQPLIQSGPSSPLSPFLSAAFSSSAEDSASLSLAHSLSPSPYISPSSRRRRSKTCMASLSSFATADPSVAPSSPMATFTFSSTFEEEGGPILPTLFGGGGKRTEASSLSTTGYSMRARRQGNRDARGRTPSMASSDRGRGRKDLRWGGRGAKSQGRSRSLSKDVGGSKRSFEDSDYDPPDEVEDGSNEADEWQSEKSRRRPGRQSKGGRRSLGEPKQNTEVVTKEEKLRRVLRIRLEQGFFIPEEERLSFVEEMMAYLLGDWNRVPFKVLKSHRH